MKAISIFFAATIGLLAACDGDKKVDPPNNAEARKKIKELTFTDSALNDCVQRAAQKLAIIFVEELSALSCNNKTKTYNSIQNITDIGQLTALTSLDLSYHGLKNIKLTTLANLKQLNLLSNPITQLDLTANNALKDLEISTFADDGKALSQQFNLFWPSQPALESVNLNLPASYTVYLYHLKNLKRATVHNLTEPFIDRLAAPNLEYLSLSGSTSLLQFPAFTNPVDVQIKSAQLTSLLVGNNANIRSMVLDTPKLNTLPVASSLQFITLTSTGVTSLDLSPAAKLAELTLGNNPNLTHINLDASQAGIKINPASAMSAPELHIRKALKYLNFASAELAQCVYTQKVAYVDELTQLTCESITSEQIHTLKGIEQLQQLEGFSLFYKALNDADFTELSKLNSITLRTSLANTDSESTPPSAFNLQLPKQSPLTQLSLSLKPGIKLTEQINLSRFTGLTSVNLEGVDEVIFGSTPELLNLTLEGDFLASSLPRDMPSLVHLSLTSTGIKSLNLPTMPNLTRLRLDLSKVPELTLPSGLNLQSLSLVNLPISRLDLSGLTDLEALDITQMANLTQLEIPKNLNLTNLGAYDTGIINWDFGNAPHLREIIIWGDATHTIRGITGSQLESLEVFGEQVANIEPQSCNKLINLTLGGGKINSFNFDACRSLAALTLSGTSINELNLTDHTQLEYLHLAENPIAKERIKLPGDIEFYYNPGCEDSKLPSCQFNNLNP